MRVDSVTGSIRQQLKPVLDSPFTLRLGLGTLKPGTDHRTEPSRTEPKYWFFRLFGSVSVARSYEPKGSARLRLLRHANRYTEQTEQG